MAKKKNSIIKRMVGEYIPVPTVKLEEFRKCGFIVNTNVIKLILDGFTLCCMPEGWSVKEMNPYVVYLLDNKKRIRGWIRSIEEDGIFEEQPHAELLSRFGFFFEGGNLVLLDRAKNISQPIEPINIERPYARKYELEKKIERVHPFWKNPGYWESDWNIEDILDVLFS